MLYCTVPELRGPLNCDQAELQQGMWENLLYNDVTPFMEFNVMLLKDKSSKRENKSNQTQQSQRNNHRNCATKAVRHDSNEDVPKAKHTTDDVEDVHVFYVPIEEDMKEMKYWIIIYQLCEDNFHFVTLE